MEFIANQNWRYATKKFDNNKKVSVEDIERLKEAVRLAASSYGLQLYRVLLVENEEIRKELQKVSYNQTQITEASHVFVFCNYTEVKPEDIDEYIELIADTRGQKVGDLEDFGTMMKTTVAGQTAQQQFNWTKNQTYIALSNLLSACAELKIDACPMEGFEAEKYNEILGLSDKKLNASVVATVGYRHSDDASQHLVKVRKPFNKLFEELK